MVIFHDRSPASRVHLLAVPKRHIGESFARLVTIMHGAGPFAYPPARLDMRLNHTAQIMSRPSPRAISVSVRLSLPFRVVPPLAREAFFRRRLTCAHGFPAS